ncbi:MAG: hypothetical protein M3545_17105 [Acidobacteriota bacterium]|nr:hypothetical protein [Acidobacteriota bacterium]
MVEQQHQIDRRLETQLRERTDTERHLEQKIEAVRELVGQQAKAVEVASEEREKAASQLRKQFAQQIEAGDNNLREHMSQQVQAVGQQIAAATRDSEIRANEAEKAILKQETATERRFESANEWRGQSLDRERSQEAQMSKLAATFAPREVLDAKVQDLEKRIEVCTRRLDQSGGQKQGETEATTARQVSNGAIVGIISALVGGAGLITAVVVAANALSGG